MDPLAAHLLPDDWHALLDDHVNSIEVEELGPKHLLEVIAPKLGGSPLELIVSEEAGLEKASFSSVGSGAALATLVSVVIANNSLTALPSFDSLRPCWLRSLNVSQNALEAGWAQPLRHLPLLLHLDVSFNDGLRLDGEDGAHLCSLKALNELHADGCGLEDVSLLEQLSTLTVLCIAENELEEVACLAPLTGLNLKRLCVAGNPMLEEARADASVRKMFASLVSLDSVSLIPAKGTSYGDLDMERARRNVKDILYDNCDKSCCTCLVGNACEKPDHCADWEQRFEVARNVRDSRVTSQGNIGMLY